MSNPNASRDLAKGTLMDFMPDHRRWARNRQRLYGRSQRYYLELIASQAGCCALSGVQLRFDAVGGTPIAGGLGCHPLYAALDHVAPGSDHEGYQVVSYALNDLKGHLPYDCFLALTLTTAWQRLMDAWRAQALQDPEDRESFYALLRQQTSSG